MLSITIRHTWLFAASINLLCRDIYRNNVDEMSPFCAFSSVILQSVVKHCCTEKLSVSLISINNLREREEFSIK